MAAEQERRNDKWSNTQQAGFVNTMQVREGINAFEQCAAIFATEVAYENSQNATLQGSKTDFQAQLQQHEA